MTIKKRLVTEEEKQERKDEIVSVFEDLYARMPMSQISLTEIARELGCNRANIVTYYPTTVAVLADAWKHKVTNFCTGFLEDLESVDTIDAPTYAEMCYQNYFVKSDIILYLEVQSAIMRNPEVKPSVLTFLETYVRLTGKHWQVLAEKANISMAQSEAIMEAVHYLALGLHSSESVASELLPDIAKRTGDYIHRRYVRMAINCIVFIMENRDRFDGAH